jgi:hypothetical protein
MIILSFELLISLDEFSFDEAAAGLSLGDFFFYLGSTKIKKKGKTKGS